MPAEVVAIDRRTGVLALQLPDGDYPHLHARKTRLGAGAQVVVGHLGASFARRLVLNSVRTANSR